MCASQEFRAALRRCGFDAPVSAMNALFDELDTSGTFLRVGRTGPDHEAIACQRTA